MKTLLGCLLLGAMTTVPVQWVRTNGPSGGVVDCFAVSGNILCAGTRGGGVFLSTNNSTSWTAVNSGLTNTNVNALAVSDTNLFAGTYSGVFRSTTNGTHWSAANAGLTNTLVMSFAVFNTHFFVGTNGGGVFLSSNSGVSWTAVNSGLTNPHVFSFAALDMNLFAGTSDGGAFLSTDRGTTWTGVETGLIRSAVVALAVSGTDLCAGAVGAGFWRRPLSEMIASADPASKPAPSEFSLRQNYPNPFNPSTKIRHGLPWRSHVTLTVFNTLGQQVATLVLSEQEAGYHEVQVDASDLATEVRLYRLQACEFVFTRRLLLLKQLREIFSAMT